MSGLWAAAGLFGIGFIYACMLASNASYSYKRAAWEWWAAVGSVALMLPLLLRLLVLAVLN